MSAEPFRAHRLAWLVPAVAAAGLTVLIMGVLPPDRTIDNLFEWAFRISPVCFAVVAIALFPTRSGRNLVLLALLTVGYLGVLDTMVITRILEFAEAADQDAAFPRLYQMTIMLNAFVVLAIAFGYRLGGAKTGKVLRLGFAGTLVLVSGLNDLTFYYSYPWPDGRPARLGWASHITVFVGGVPTPTTAIVFCAVHLLLAAAVITVPWWLRRRRLAAEVVTGPEAAAEPR
jgi:hypothetical protein